MKRGSKAVVFSILVIMFSSKGFSQNTEKSEHPLLDKYYPQKKNVVDTPKAITPPPSTAAETKMAPAITNNPTTNSSTNTIVPVAAPTAVITPAPVAADTAVISEPAAVPVTPPEQKPVTRLPPAPPYRDTRLGSSTPQYDTWEKNSNGAGSVTTSPK